MLGIIPAALVMAVVDVKEKNRITKFQLENMPRLREEYIKEGENAWSANIPQELRLNVAGAKLSQIYKRLDSKKPAYTR